MPLDANTSGLFPDRANAVPSRWPFDAHLPLVRYEQQQGVGLAVRKYVLMRRGLVASDTQRKPASAFSGGAGRSRLFAGTACSPRRADSKLHVKAPKKLNANQPTILGLPMKFVM